jgi:hypothetical protein
MGRWRSTCECLPIIFYNTNLNMDIDPYIDILYYFDLKLYLVFCRYELECYCRSILPSTL